MGPSAIDKHGGEENMKTHLADRKARARAVYDEKMSDFRTAKQEQCALQRAGDAKAAAAVTMGPKKTKVPKRAPAMPPLLRNSSTPSFYSHCVTFHPGWLGVDDEGHTVKPDPGDLCAYCSLIVWLRGKQRGEANPDPSGLTLQPKSTLPKHRQAHVHRAMTEKCKLGCSEDGDKCDACLNYGAFFLTGLDPERWDGDVIVSRRDED